MPSLQLSNDSDVLDLDYVLKTGRGIQVTSGVTGLGLGAKQAQWLEGAGNGSLYRGTRALARDIDLPLYVLGDNRADLKYLMARLAKMLAGPCVLTFTDDDGTAWATTVVHTGGGDYTYGKDTVGERELQTVITVRAGDPFFTATSPMRQTIKGVTQSRGLIGKLVNLRLASSQRIGSITLSNTGDADAYPIWTVYGPGDTFTAISPTGQTLQWNGTLAATDVLTIDTKAGTVVDQTGANRYDKLAPAPRFWTVPQGTSTAQCSLLNVNSASTITCTYNTRRWLVV